MIAAPRRLARAFRRRRVLATAVCELAVARLRLALSSERGLIEWLRRPQMAAAAGGVDLDSLSWALAAGARRVPWRADCLVAALAATRWLRRLRLAPEAFVGVAKTADGGFLAHAWARCEDHMVVGAAGAGFVVLVGAERPQASGSERLR